MAFRSLGKITVTSAGTPVRVTTNESVPSARVALQSISVFASAGNTGANMYLGNSTMNKSTFAGCYAIIPKGTVLPAVINLAPAGINAADLYLDADHNDDLALVSGTEQ